MKKILCGNCQCALFSRLILLHDYTDPEKHNCVDLQEREIAYKCEICGLIYTKNEIDNHIRDGIEWGKPDERNSIILPPTEDYIPERKMQACLGTTE